uniref:SFRICE_034016 n=1 Tax=Spodoptera frugiperda TaxID=7108 RepID=A0A2H1V613_SPOFR
MQTICENSNIQKQGVTAGGGGWEPLGTPYFDNSTKREATAAVGQPAYLHCRVRNLADRAWNTIADLLSIK